jgi:hypothetical protein
MNEDKFGNPAHTVRVVQNRHSIETERTERTERTWEGAPRVERKCVSLWPSHWGGFADVVPQAVVTIVVTSRLNLTHFPELG